MKIVSQIKSLLNIKSIVIFLAFFLVTIFLLQPSEVIQKEKIEVLKFTIIK